MPEEPTLQLQTPLLKRQDLKYDDQALIALLTWCKSHKLDLTEDFKSVTGLADSFFKK